MKRSPRSACMLLAPICDPAMTGVCPAQPCPTWKRKRVSWYDRT